NAGMARRHQMFEYHVEQILQALAKRPDVDALEVARREYVYLPALDRASEPLAIHRLLQRDPMFFAQVVADVFRPSSSKDDQDAAPSESDRSRASMSYRLLQSWKLIPGQDGPEIDGSTLLSWIAVARERMKV